MAACVIGYCGLYLTIFYVSFYGESEHILSERMAFYIVPILNAASILGRTVSNWFSDHFGPLNIMAPSAIIMSVLTICFIAADYSAALITLAVLYGIFSGVYLSLPGVVMVSITKDKIESELESAWPFVSLDLVYLPVDPGAVEFLVPTRLRQTGRHLDLRRGLCPRIWHDLVWTNILQRRTTPHGADIDLRILGSKSYKAARNVNLCALYYSMHYATWRLFTAIREDFCNFATFQLRFVKHSQAAGDPACVHCIRQQRKCNNCFTSNAPLALVQAFRCSIGTVKITKR